MEKKYLGIACIVMIILSVIIYNYQKKSQEKYFKEKAEQEEKTYLDSLDILESAKPLSDALEAQLKDFIATTEKENGKENIAERLYFITLNKDNAGEYVKFETGYGFNPNDVKGFAIFNNYTIIYRGNNARIKQSVIDESQFNPNLATIEYYREQKSEKGEISSSRCYNIVNGSELMLSKK